MPVICQTAENVTLDRHKYLCPSDMTVIQFLYVLRRRMRLFPSEALFIAIKKESDTIIPVPHQSIGELYEQFNEAGVLNMFVYKEHAYGSLFM